MVVPPTSPASPVFRLSPQLIIGLLVISVGVVFMLDELGITPAVTYLRYWPSVFIVIGVLKMLQSRDGGGALTGLIFTVVGVWLQAEELNLIHLRLWDVWPVALVLFGAYLVWQALTRPQPAPTGTNTLPIDQPPQADVSTVSDRWNEPAPSRPAEKTARADRTARITDTQSRMTAVAVLGGVSRGNNSRAFRGADLLVIMGGCEIDLRQAAIHGEAVIDVFVMWGGVEIRVPEDWTVASQVFPLMGGVDDKTRPPQGATTHRLVLRGAAVMGGIEIKN
jgi:hypothetical protein